MLFAKTMPDWWIFNEEDILHGHNCIKSYIRSPDGSTQSCFTLHRIPRSNGREDKYWHRIEIREKDLLSGDPSVKPVRARFLLPRGLIQLSEAEKIELLEVAFDSLVQRSTTRGVEFVGLVDLDCALDVICDKGVHGANGTYIFGHTLTIKKFSQRMSITMLKLPSYDKDHTVSRPIVVASCFVQRTEGSIAIADRLFDDWEVRSEVETMTRTITQSK
jgi:hypothetical protein